MDAEEVVVTRAVRRRAARRDGVSGIAMLCGAHVARYLAKVDTRQAVGHGMPLQRRFVGGRLLAVRTGGRLQRVQISSACRQVHT